MLVPDIDHARALLGQPRREVHVGVAHKGEADLAALLRHGAGNVVEDLSARGLHAGPSSNAPGTMTAPFASRRAVRTRPADFIWKPSAPWA